MQITLQLMLLLIQNKRNIPLSLYVIAMPVGSAFGFIIGSQVAAAFNSWRWAFRVSPPIGALMVIFAIFFMLDPPRGVIDGHERKG